MEGLYSRRLQKKWRRHSISHKVWVPTCSTFLLYNTYLTLFPLCIHSCIYEVLSMQYPCHWTHCCIHRGVETLSEKKGLNISSSPPSDDSYLTQLLSEMELLKERNKSMEGELREMQERYSDISLKFAEVEGERQQLVMKVRNLKNTNKK